MSSRHVGHADQIFDVGLLFVSFGTAFLGSYLAICLLEQLRAIYLHQGSGNMLNRLKWYFLIGLSLGGIGIWSMHFVGMASLRLREEVTRDPVPVRFNIAVSIISIIVVVLTTSMGALVSSYDRLFAKSKAEILEMFISESTTMSIGQIKKLKNWIIVRIMCTKDLRLLVTGGAIAGSGVSIMHYIGMAAMEFPGYIKWDAGIIAGSILIAIFAATAAFWILFRVLSIFPNFESLRLTSAAIMMVAVCGMHYTGMAAATMIFTRQDEPQKVPSASVSQFDVIIPLIVAEMLVCWMIAIVLFSDLRNIVHKYRYQLKKHNVFTPGKMNNNSSISSNSSSEMDPGEGRLFASFSSKLFKKNHSGNMTHTTDSHPSSLNERVSSITFTKPTPLSKYGEFNSMSSSFSHKILIAPSPPTSTTGHAHGHNHASTASTTVVTASTNAHDVEQGCPDRKYGAMVSRVSEEEGEIEEIVPSDHVIGAVPSLE